MVSVPVAALVCLAVSIVSFGAGHWLGSSALAAPGAGMVASLLPSSGLGGVGGRGERKLATQAARSHQIQEPTQFEPAFPESVAKRAQQRRQQQQQDGGGVRAQLQREAEEEGELLRQEVAFLRRRALAMRKAWGSATCESKGIGPRGGFCVKSSAGSSDGTGTMLDTKLCARLGQLFANLTVADLGAGIGQYGRCLRPAVHLYAPYDGGEGVEEATAGVVRFLDLSEPTWLGRSYDWVMSLEVGEHIPAAHEGAYLGNVLRHATRGVVLSWAVPGQGGHHHINERPNDYIVRQVEARGFKHDPQLSVQLRNASSPSHWWFKNTMMVFHRVA